MRCEACNCILSEYEQSRKDIFGDYINLCNACLYPTRNEVSVENNHDLYIINDGLHEEYTELTGEF